ncbi:NodT family efflux transporter outer membrane factor (OMF) lipoprotein [Herbaspirillum sp. Sphag1AN]|uniref:efflux transporter outer membrane subunit n=1 Tax=unclassified Herbaspirillum TaxID=2624150 RepID=UPI001615DB51|nr:MULTISPECIES: efflux transporter outer membrane subunit [unclassified Herbaspirillum]MBB3211823.1 NodT family efflux transporter outer membrane factor (OMF) lipoprotein [Herbaspirillum sp. Sphag1AN]MBB3244343.1 NodT family efflux transporter outer membrane factor (OMF) lipoprotein [Herbaspirillum sp. Sphag64]
MRTVKFAITTLMTSLLAACAVGPDYLTPDLASNGNTNDPGTTPLSNHYLHAPNNSHAAAPAVTDAVLSHWWSQFHDPVLTQIIDRVLAQNLDLQAALARVQQARAVASIAEAALLPSGSADVQAASERQSLRSPLGEIASNYPGYQRNQTQYDLGAGASWEIDLFGGLRREREADQATAEAAAADGVVVRISIAAEAADAYFRLRGAQARLAVMQEQIGTATQLQELVGLRLHDGLANRRDLAQAQAQLAQAHAAMTPLQTEIDVQRNRLDVLMGVQPGTLAAQLTASSSTTSTTGLTAAPGLSTLPAPAALLRRRPDVIAAERRLAASNARIGVAMAEYYPKFSLSGLLGFESLSRAEISGQTFQPLAVAGLHWRLFDFGRVDAEVAGAKGANAEALSRFKQAMLRATEDVENALVTETQLQAQQQALQQQNTATADARNAAQEAFEAGALSRIDVLEQERQLLAAREQLVLTNANVARASVATYRALGGGW